MMIDDELRGRQGMSVEVGEAGDEHRGRGGRGGAIGGGRGR